MFFLKHLSFFLCLIIYSSFSIHSTHGQFMAGAWKDAIIPYEIDPALAIHKATILAAMKEITGTTCIKFVPRKAQSRYLNIKSSQSCTAVVNHTYGAVPFNLSNLCVCKGIIMHGLYHAAGIGKPGAIQGFPCIPQTFTINDPKLCAKSVLNQTEINQLKKLYKC